MHNQSISYQDISLVLRALGASEMYRDITVLSRSPQIIQFSLEIDNLNTNQLLAGKPRYLIARRGINSSGQPERYCF